MTTLKTLCVYCGSSSGRNDAYLSAAAALADAMISQNIRLVYGGASIGIMGAVADRMLAQGGEVIGVIPKALAHKEIAHANLSELHITHSMHERKMRMAELADGFVALPGGIGTLEELFEIWTWAQLGFHDKPCALLNVAGFYDALINFLDQVTAEQFVKPIVRDMLIVENDANRLLERMDTYQAPAVRRWLVENET